jgi:hypothetical protein
MFEERPGGQAEQQLGSVRNWQAKQQVKEEVSEKCPEREMTEIALIRKGQ